MPGYNAIIMEEWEDRFGGQKVVSVYLLYPEVFILVGFYFLYNVH